jgi:Uma2 family endonuclease
MLEWIENGAQLGWLIDPIDGTATIYRPDRELEHLNRPATLTGEGPVEGFVLVLNDIWADIL